MPEVNSDILFARLENQDFQEAFRVASWEHLAPGPGTVAWASANARFNEVFLDHSLSRTKFYIVNRIPCSNHVKADLYYAVALKCILPEYIKYESDAHRRNILAREHRHATIFCDGLVRALEEHYNIEINGL